jgi:hypothetical protein
MNRKSQRSETSRRPCALNRKHLLALLITLVFVFPRPARAGVTDIISLLRAITSTLQQSIGVTLNNINTIETSVRDFRQQVVWPLNLVNQVKAAGLSIRSHYQTFFAQAARIPIASATLAAPSGFEGIVRSANAGNLTQLQLAFSKVYGLVPPATDVPPLDRNIIDMDDTSAADSLKATVISDQSSAQSLAHSDLLETKALAAAPGSAPLLTAQALAAQLATQANLAKLLAADLRLEATRLAHDNAVRKKSAVSARNLQLQMQQLLTHP